MMKSDIAWGPTIHATQTAPLDNDNGQPDCSDSELEIQTFEGDGSSQIGTKGVPDYTNCELETQVGVHCLEGQNARQFVDQRFSNTGEGWNWRIRANVAHGATPQVCSFFFFRYIASIKKGTKRHSPEPRSKVPKGGQHEFSWESVSTKNRNGMMASKAYVPHGSPLFGSLSLAVAVLCVITFGLASRTAIILCGMALGVTNWNSWLKMAVGLAN